MKDYNPYSGVFWVPEDQLSPKLQEAKTQPSWELHYSMTEAIVKKAIQDIGWYHFPSISDHYYESKINKMIYSEAGFIEVITTQEIFLVAKLPLKVEWYYVGMVRHWDWYYLAFYPEILSVDGKNWLGEHGGYFVGLEKALINILTLPYLVNPKGDCIVRKKGKKGIDTFSLLSEKSDYKSKKKKHPLLRSED